MTTNVRQRRIALGILLSTLAGTGVLTASGTTQLVASSLLPLASSAPGGPGGPSKVRPAKRAEVDPAPILHRNIFDSQLGPLDGSDEGAPEPPPVAEPTAEPEELNPDSPPPACEGGSMRLVGAFVLTRRPEDSFAAITDSTGSALLYQEGMRVDNRTVVAIWRSRVVLRPEGQAMCSLSMFSGEPRVATAAPAGPAKVAKAAPPTKRPSGTPEGLSTAEVEQGISQVNDTTWTIQRSLVDRLLSNQAAMMRTARVIPHESGGRTVGVKLYGIRRSSLLGRLGIQNGDMLRTINGYDMTQPDRALEAYARLRTADRITINVTRRGREMTLDYQIQ